MSGVENTDTQETTPSPELGPKPTVSRGVGIPFMSEMSDQPGAQQLSDEIEFTGVRVPRFVLNQWRAERNREPGRLSAGEMLTYWWWRMKQLELNDGSEHDMSTWTPEQVKAWVMELRTFPGSGKIAEWVKTWRGGSRARQLEAAIGGDSGEADGEVSDD